MQPFVFHHNTKIFFGRTALARLGTECAGLGKKVLLLYGRHHLHASGLHRRITQALATAGVSWVEYGGVRPNPTLNQVRDGIALARQNGVQAVVAVGGGSVMDSAKAVAAGACVAHDVWLFFRGKKSIRQALPLLCVPTVAGSGSECNHGMVLTNEGNGQKIGLGNRHLLPAVALMDPELTGSVGWRQTLYGAVDTISHLLEIFCTADPAPLQDRLATALGGNIMACCEKLRQHPTDYQSRAELLWASALALSGLNSAGRGRVNMPAHALAHALGGRYDLPHGALLAVILPAWLRFIAARQPQRIAAWCRGLFPATPAEGQQDPSSPARMNWPPWSTMPCPRPAFGVLITATRIYCRFCTTPAKPPPSPTIPRTLPPVPYSK
ncbi:iron-containing alcohol dehydrogenase [Desulfurivibrio alkaliphilus]|uniref:Iron-containing alcohol dehydrogenase n=1 Tax=Desulfurivibrio alkaliphilus (strain DSM 19089 / UNIQEM U267 / AHT2) TaxID=589865 RepID=D6Z166_DESAT|nr:iron-containing alcohol dehydrogenase [Desulfurivibrio alkaliphilus]ADH85321.1 iron-containing alcohol dehydrogenase [Desulfurivibrio alkaliphilus AHT 2]